MEQTKKYYGFRFFSGRGCTIGTPHPTTGRMSRAGESVVFDTREELREWLGNENYSSPCGLGGGERIACSKKALRSYNLGSSVEDFELELEMYGY